MSKFKHINIIVNSNCNLKCIYCYMNIDKHKVKIDLPSFKKYILEIKKNGIESVTFTGGEIFLQKEIFSMLEFAKNQGLYIEVITNGSVDIKNSYKFVDKFTYSLDGTQNCMKLQRSISNSTNIIKNIKKCLAEGVSVNINMVVTNLSINSFKQNINFIINDVIDFQNLVDRNKVLINIIAVSKTTKNDNSFLLNNVQLENLYINIKEIYEVYNFHVKFKTNILKKEDFIELYSSENYVKLPIWYNVNDKLYFINQKTTYKSLSDLEIQYEKECIKYTQSLLNKNNKYILPYDSF